MLKLFKKSNSSEKLSWQRTWTMQGVLITPRSSGPTLNDPLFPGYLAQLQDDGYALETNDGILINWDSLFEALADPTYTGLYQSLNLPSQEEKRPILCSNNSLTDEDFSITLAGWDDSGHTYHELNIIGAILLWNDSETLMQAQHWYLIKEVIAFARRPDDQRDDLSHRQWWGRIRKLALTAQVKLDDFLHRSVVLTPEKLEIGLRKSAIVNDDNVIEIEPRFQDSPDNWLERFDSSKEVLNRYDIVTSEGIIQILITPQVKSVLQEIKRLPLRRVAGARAQAFILNPFAALGEDANNVIIEEQFEHAREEAGLHYERFSPIVERDTKGYLSNIGLLIETASATDPSFSEKKWLDDTALTLFINKLESSLSHGFQLLGWEGYDLELQVNTQEHLDVLKAALAERSQYSVLLTYEQVYDLSRYSSRIEGLGIEKPYYSPYIAKKNQDEGWFPENVAPIISYTPNGEDNPVNLAVTDDILKKIEIAVNTARKTAQSSIEIPELPQPIAVGEAENIVNAFKKVDNDIKSNTFHPKEDTAKKVTQKKSRKSLILKKNIHILDYEEKRKKALQPKTFDPILPKSLRPECSLLSHQTVGVAWLQHLYNSHVEYQVNGAVLADDMGLGKTLQLLTFIAWLIEQEPNIEPALIVAPVSLLENWKEESEKFFRPGTLSILMAYGESLAPLRLPKKSIDQRLRNEDGLISFLKPDWIGNYKIILTTYETLRDMEFSFAAQKWSIMVCDEAQRIKNPAAMVTRAAKKQNVIFKIACTGTPVENTLADLWCLFDYIQPGHLGALDEFGRRYRKPIEAKTDEDKKQVKKLRTLIEPQILRRTKVEVATDLPKKIVVDECRSLSISPTQRNLYAQAIDEFKKRNDDNCSSPFKNYLGLLHYLRLLCTHPRRHGLTAFNPTPLAQYRVESPKLDWLLKQLKTIQKKNEKIIIFCEFRDIQRLIQYYVQQVFGFSPAIINGSTSAASSHPQSRQKQIKIFQETTGFNAIILSPIAVGFGVNIQSANHVIHYTRTWNPAKEDQATDRAYRIGQVKDVYVYHPVICAHDFKTFDAKLDELLKFKRSLADDMLNGTGDIASSDFEIRDIIPNEKSDNIDEILTLDDVLSMEWRHFEGLIAAIWQKRGFEQSYCTPASNDHGVDVIAIKGQIGEIIQVKTITTEKTKLGWNTVKEVVAGEAFYQRQYPDIKFKKVGITNQYFNDSAKEQAKLNHVELLEQSDLAQLIEKYPVTMLEVEHAIFS